MVKLNSTAIRQHDQDPKEMVGWFYMDLDMPNRYYK
jgi:hypothetical protein